MSREKLYWDKLRELAEEKHQLEQENQRLKNIHLKWKKYDYILPILEENNRLKQQLALAMHDNERLIDELGMCQHITRHLTT